MNIENRKKNKEARVLLDNIRSVHNVGSIFRTAETLGINKIYCLGTTPTPIDRFGRAREDLAKVALGAEKTVAWEYLEDLTAADRLMIKLKGQGFRVVALEQDKNSIDYKEIKIGDKSLIIFGNEVEGVSENLLGISDFIAEIPMYGQKESLNVSIAAGIFLFRLFDL